MTVAYVGLGSNLNHPKKQVKTALRHIQQLPQTCITRISRLYETAPLGPQNQANFINQVIVLKTSLTALNLLKALQEIENAMGRARQGRWGPRVIDCDILLYGNDRMTSETLTIPHPGLTTRAFVLYPLLEIAPDLILPTGKTVQQCVATCSSDTIKRVM